MAAPLEKWLEMLIFTLLFVFINAIILLVCWFCQSMTSASRRSVQSDFSYLSHGPNGVDQRWPVSGTSLKLRQRQGGDDRGSSQPQNQKKQQQQQKQLRKSDGASGGKDLNSDSGDDCDVATAIRSRKLDRVVDSRLTYRMSCLLIGTHQEHSKTLMQSLVSRESRGTRTSLVQQDSDRSSSPLPDGFQVLEVAELTMADLMLPERQRKSLTIEYARYHTLVPVQRFDSEYTRLGGLGQGLNYDLLGAAFLEGFLVEFDRAARRVGFAQSTCGSGTVSGPLPLGGGPRDCAFFRADDDGSSNGYPVLRPAAIAMATVCVMCVLPVLALLVWRQAQRPSCGGNGSGEEGETVQLMSA